MKTSEISYKLRAAQEIRAQPKKKKKKPHMQKKKGKVDGIGGSFT